MNNHEAEVNRIRKVYEEFSARNAAAELWSPFSFNEMGVRVQQLITFSEMMAGIGKVNLSGMKILDYGCGEGRHLRQFLDMGAEPELVCGVDLSEASIRIARQRSPNLRIEMGDGQSVPFPNESMDLATLHFVMGSIGSEELRTHLGAELARILKPGGYLYWWDSFGMTAASGKPGAPLRAASAIPLGVVERREVRARPAPSWGMRPMRGLRSAVQPLLDGSGWPFTFEAVLFRK